MIRVMWFVLAGFVLGFAASTLWEWYYYRRQRIRLQDRRLAELQAQGQVAERLPEVGDTGWHPPEYRSSGVLLEAEAPAEELEPDFAPAELAPNLDQGAAEAVPVDQASAEPVATAAADAATRTEESQPPMAPLPAGEPPAADVPKVRLRAPMPRRSLGYPDDLAEIKGIGEVYRRRLYEAGIFTWHQVAQVDVEELRTVTKAQASANVEEWPAQALALAEQHGRLGVSYTGPPPDDLTAIPGIGPVNAQQLYRAGICTYEQLAAALPDELTPLFAAPVAGHDFDFPLWFARAAELAAAKRTAIAGST